MVNVNKNGKILSWHFKFPVFIIGFEIICLYINCFKSRPCYWENKGHFAVNHNKRGSIDCSKIELVVVTPLTCAFFHLSYWHSNRLPQKQLYINNCPMRCNTKQSIYYSASSLYTFRVSKTPIIRSTQNCNYSIQVLVIFFVQLPPFNVAKLATLEGGSCTKNMTSTGCCSYSFVYSWWWVWLTPETCRVNLQNNK